MSAMGRKRTFSRWNKLIQYRVSTVRSFNWSVFLHQRRTAIERDYWLSRENAEIKMAFPAKSRNRQ